MDVDSVGFCSERRARAGNFAIEASMRNMVIDSGGQHRRRACGRKSKRRHAASSIDVHLDVAMANAGRRIRSRSHRRNVNKSVAPTAVDSGISFAFASPAEQDHFNNGCSKYPNDVQKSGYKADVEGKDPFSAGDPFAPCVTPVVPDLSGIPVPPAFAAYSLEMEDGPEGPAGKRSRKLTWYSASEAVREPSLASGAGENRDAQESVEGVNVRICRVEEAIAETLLFMAGCWK